MDGVAVGVSVVRDRCSSPMDGVAVRVVVAVVALVVLAVNGVSRVVVAAAAAAALEWESSSVG